MLQAVNLWRTQIEKGNTMHLYRTHTCGALRAENIDEQVRVSGWVHRKRDHGGLLLLICATIMGSPSWLSSRPARILRWPSKFVPKVSFVPTAKVVARDDEARNPICRPATLRCICPSWKFCRKPATCLSRFSVSRITLKIFACATGFWICAATRYTAILYCAPTLSVGYASMTADGFREYQTPILTASSPEGARDFLVPSRMHPGKFYALPQAPQQFKQLLMVAGFDRYFQIAPCFRDEDARADRSPGEFYQLDLEMSFVTQEDVFACVEPVLRDLFQTFGNGKRVTEEFPRIPYAEAMQKYGSDKPDLRIPIEMQDVTPAFDGSDFKIFANMIAKDERVRVWAIPAKTGSSRAFCDRMNSWAQGEGQPGLGYIFFREGEGAGPLAKNIGPERTEQIRTQLGLEDGDAVFFCAGVPKAFAEFAGRAQPNWRRAGAD